MTLPVEGEGLDIVAKNEPVLAATSLFDLVLQPIHPALIRIELPFADEGIAGCVRGSADKAEGREECENLFLHECLLFRFGIS
jgi:hypothetical protein